MIQILCTADHTARAQALAQVVPGAAWGLVSIAPAKLVGLDTLTFWGHGTLMDLCDLPPHSIGKIVRQWKKLNSGLKTVEIITCNSRHTAVGQDPFAKNLKRDFSAGLLSDSRDIKLKALPVSAHGSIGSYSILLANATNQSWCYVTGGGVDDKDMWTGANAVKDAAKPFGGNLAQGANKVASVTKGGRFTLNYGPFTTLRSSLVKV